MYYKEKHTRITHIYVYKYRENGFKVTAEKEHGGFWIDEGQVGKK